MIIRVSPRLAGVAVAAWLGLAGSSSAQFVPDTTPLDMWGPNGAVEAVARSGDRLVVGGSFDYVGPPTGSLGIIDASSGALIGASRQAQQPLNAIVSDGTGGWFGAMADRVVHLLPDGRIDPTFNAPAASWQGVRALAVHGSRVFAAGTFDAVGGEGRDRVAAFDRTSGALLPFSLSFSPTSHDVSVLAVEGDDLVIGGNFAMVQGQFRGNLALVDLTSDQVRPSQPVDALEVASVAATPTRIYVAGRCVGATPGSTTPLCAFDRASGARVAWSPSLTLPDSYPRPLLVTAGSAVVVASHSVIAALDPGSASERWRVVAHGAVRALVADGGHVYAGGEFPRVEAQERRRLVKIDVTTGAIEAWAHAGQPVGAMAAGGGRVAVGGGLLNSVGGVPRSALAVLDLMTGRVTDVDPPLGFLRVTAVAVVGPNVVATGTAGLPGFGDLRAFDLATGAAHLWNPMQDGYISALATDGQRLFLAGYGVVMGRGLNGLGVIDLGTLTYSPAANSPIECCIDGLEVSNGAVYVRGNFRAVPGYGRAGFAAYDAATLTLLPWSPPNVGPLRMLNGFAFWRDRIFVSGSRTAWTDRNSGAELDVPAELPPFTAGAGAIGRAADLIVYGGYTRFAGYLVTAMDAATGRALPWQVPLDGLLGGSVNVVRGYSDLIVVGGNMTRAGGVPVNGIAVFRMPAPGPPRRLSAIVSGSVVALAWQPAAGVLPLGYEVSAGLTPGGTELGAFDLPGTSLTATVPPATYYVRVRARGLTGTSAPSSEVVLTTPSTPIAPQAPGGLAASVSGGVVTLSWGAAVGNATTYVVEAGTASGLANIGAVATGHLDTVFTTAAPPGTYFVRVRAANGFGVSGATNEVAVVVP